MSRNEKSLKEAIDELINSYHLKPKLNQTRLNVYWEKWMGKTIAKHTRNIFIKDRKLFLYLDNASLKQELMYAREKIIELVNESLEGDVIDEVIIR